MKYIHYFNHHPSQKRILLFLSSFCVLLSFVSYVGMLGYLFFLRDTFDLIKTVLIPLSTIIIVEIIRHFYNRPRPFEKYQFQPLIEHSTGKSFPSKHATSALIIALTLYPLFPLLGILLMINALCVGLTRILSGIHYPSDVGGGYILAIFMHIIGNYIFTLIINLIY